MTSLLFVKRFVAIAPKNVVSMSMNIAKNALKNAVNAPKPAMLTIMALLSLVKNIKYALKFTLSAYFFKTLLKTKHTT